MSLIFRVPNHQFENFKGVSAGYNAVKSMLLSPSSNLHSWGADPGTEETNYRVRYRVTLRMRLIGLLARAVTSTSARGFAPKTFQDTSTN